MKEETWHEKQARQYHKKLLSNDYDKLSEQEKRIVDNIRDNKQSIIDWIKKCFSSAATPHN